MFPSQLQGCCILINCPVSIVIVILDWIEISVYTMIKH